MLPTEDRQDYDQRIVMGVQPKYWNRNAGREEKITTLCHEFHHIFYPHHKPEFWEEHTQSLNHLYFRRDLLKSAFATKNHEEGRISFDWGRVWKRLIDSIQYKSVDGRMETVEERRKKAKKYISNNSPFSYTQQKKVKH